MVWWCFLLSTIHLVVLEPRTNRSCGDARHYAAVEDASFGCILFWTVICGIACVIGFQQLKESWPDTRCVVCILVLHIVRKFLHELRLKEIMHLPSYASKWAFEIEFVRRTHSSEAGFHLGAGLWVISSKGSIPLHTGIHIYLDTPRVLGSEVGTFFEHGKLVLCRNLRRWFE